MAAGSGTGANGIIKVPSIFGSRSSFINTDKWILEGADDGIVLGPALAKHRSKFSVRTRPGGRFWLQFHKGRVYGGKGGYPPTLLSYSLVTAGSVPLEETRWNGTCPAP